MPTDPAPEKVAALAAALNSALTALALRVTTSRGGYPHPVVASDPGAVDELAKSLDARLTPPPAEPIHQLGTLDTDRPEDDLRAEFFAYIGTDEDAATPVLTNLGNLRAIARLAAGYDVARIEEGERQRAALERLELVGSTLARITADGDAVTPHPRTWHEFDAALEQARAALAASDEAVRP